jgi:uncharacterized protein YihD (DUF1040 family)
MKNNLNLFTPPKFARGCLSKRLDGNAFSIIAYFQKCARDSGWEKEDIDKVIELAKSGTYLHLIGVFATHLSTNNNDFVDLFPKIELEVSKANEEHLDQYLDANTHSYQELKNQKSKLGLMAVAMEDILYNNRNSRDFFMVGDGVESAGASAAFLEHVGGNEIKELFRIFKKNISDYEDHLSDFLDNLTQEVLKLIDSGEDEEIDTTISDYEWEECYVIGKCNCCGHIDKEYKMSSEYGELRCDSCNEDADEDYDD